MTELDVLRAELAELRALLPAPREVTPGWGERTCQQCGIEGTVTLADVIDLQRPAEVPPQSWNGEGYCKAHADEYGITAEGHPHLTRPGPKRKKT